MKPFFIEVTIGRNSAKSLINVANILYITPAGRGEGTAIWFGKDVALTTHEDYLDIQAQIENLSR